MSGLGGLAWNYAFNHFKYGLIGNKVRLSACSLCQLRCQRCPTQRRGIDFLGKGYLRAEDFRRFIDRHRSIRNVELSHSGEIFLNPELESILAYAHERGVSLSALSGVNLNTAGDAVLESLVKYRLKEMVVSIDGASQKTYGLYRIGGDFERVADNLRKINRFKAKYGSPFPRLLWQFILFGHNEHEIGAARGMARELGMEFFTKFNEDAAYSPIKNRVAVEAAAGVGVPPEAAGSSGLFCQAPLCRQLWSGPQINWDGRLLGCCVNCWGDFGNVFKDGLSLCVKNKSYRDAKAAVRGRKSPGRAVPCAQCWQYKNMAASQRYLKLFDGVDFFGRVVRELGKDGRSGNTRETVSAEAMVP